MSPILVRPVREQLEHDRVIRLLQARYKRKFEVLINPGHEQVMSVNSGTLPWYPDLVLQSPDKQRSLAGVVEVETVESVNHLEAMSQWGALSRVGVPFHLYVPTACVENARRLASDFGLSVTELWAYQTIGDQPRFTLVHRTGEDEDHATRARAQGARGAGKSTPSHPPKAAKPVTPSKPVSRKSPATSGKTAAPVAGKSGASARKGSAAAKPARAGAKKVAAGNGRASTPAARKPAKVTVHRGSTKPLARKGAPPAKAQKRK